ncbi:MAG: hypothetical protein CME69_10975 [Halobacteriovorax sp.]|nr:hypothetical protein [Halobacteriovorax sp.]|tara:strand:+ start:527 stop:1159 length:633 start_codon:yes stop_codon:yes gene_type:complete
MEENTVEENSIFKTIDNYLFEQMGILKKSQFAEKMTDTIRSFPEEKQILLNQASNILILFLPLVILIIFTIISVIQSASLADQKEISNAMVLIKENEGKLNKLINTYTARSVIEDKRSFVDDFTKSLERKGFPTDKLSIDNYDDAIRGSSIKVVKAEISFKEIANKSLKTLLLEIQNIYKAKITNLKINKDIKKSRLSGSLSIELLSKAF